jgi:hypothetical protein
MGAHHTKDKGDLGVAKAFADLVEKGWLVLFPATEHAPFDLVAYRVGEFCRIQVKFRSVRFGTIEIRFRTGWSDRHGVHQKPIDKTAVDVLCVYCPETRECYYLDPRHHRDSVSLRITPSRNGQVKGVLRAEDFRDLPSRWSRSPAPTAPPPAAPG